MSTFLESVYFPIMIELIPNFLAWHLKFHLFLYLILFYLASDDYSSCSIIFYHSQPTFNTVLLFIMSLLPFLIWRVNEAFHLKINIYIYIYIYLFIWLHWVLVVAWELLVAACGI